MSITSKYAQMQEDNPLRYKWIWITLGCLMMSVISVGSLINLSPVSIELPQDKVMHFLAYGLLMGWFAQIFHRHAARLLLVLVFVLLGVAIEFLQGMVPYRQFEIMDMIANTSGVLFAWFLSYTRLGNVLNGVERYLNRLFSANELPH